MGFAGSPFTIAAYMVEGESSAGFRDLKTNAGSSGSAGEAPVGPGARGFEYAQMQAECG
ncbi:MAG: uroporphyrinogen decarboxylase family protein [Bacilli bacterium]